jgi:hypothetical protein
MWKEYQDWELEGSAQGSAKCQTLQLEVLLDVRDMLATLTEEERLREYLLAVMNEEEPTEQKIEGYNPPPFRHRCSLVPIKEAP